MNGKKLKYISGINYQNPLIKNETKGFLIDKKEENKNIHFKILNFNPSSYFLEKYSSEFTNGLNKKKIFIYNYRNNLKDNKTINKSNSAGKKIKLRPININKANYRTIFQPKVGGILIPSKKTSKDLVDYNKSNAHNTLLNYYHRNNRNVKIITFVKSKSFDKNLGFNISSNESLNNNNSNNYDSINYIQKINNKPKIPEHVLKRNQKYKSSSLEAKHSLKKGRNFVKSAAEMYEAGVYGRKYLMRNLLYFHSYFFDKNKKNKWKRLNPVFKVDNQLNSDKINLPDSLSKKIDFDGLYRDKYGSSSNFNKSRNRKRIPNDKNNLTYKEIRDLSLQGYKRMKAYKIRQLNLRLKNTNDEVLDLEHKLDELLEVNKKMFLIAE